MIYDMRTYDLQPGAVQQYMDAVREVALDNRAEARMIELWRNGNDTGSRTARA